MAELHHDLSYEPLEGQLRDQMLGAALVTTDLLNGPVPGPVALLDLALLVLVTSVVRTRGFGDTGRGPRTVRALRVREGRGRLSGRIFGSDHVAGSELVRWSV